MQEEYIYITFEVGVLGVHTLDDVFEMPLPMTPQERDELIAISKREMWNMDSDEWYYIEDFMPEVYARFVNLAHAEAINQYGCTGYHYEFFLPDEIEDAIWNSEEGKRFEEAKQKMQNNIKESWKHDTALLKREFDNHRWQGKVINYSGISICEGMEGAHHFDFIPVINYSKNYTLTDTSIEIKGASLKTLTQFMASSKYRDTYSMEIVERGQKQCLHIIAYNSPTDIEVLFDFLDLM